MADAPDYGTPPDGPCAYELALHVQAAFIPPGVEPGWPGPGMGPEPGWLGPGIGPEPGWLGPGMGPEPGWLGPGIGPEPGWQTPATGLVPATGPQPGGLPLRPLLIGEIIRFAFLVMRRNPLTMFGLTALVMTCCSVVALAVSDLSLESFTTATAALGLLLVVLTAPVLLFLGDAIVTGMLTAVVSQSVLGRRLSVAEAWRMARPRVLAVIGAVVLSTLTTIAAVIGTFAFCFMLAGRARLLPPTLLILLTLLAIAAVITFLTARFSVAAPVVGLERKGPAESLARSWRLVRSGTWRVAGFVLLTYLLVGMATLCVEIPFDMTLHAADPGLFGGLFAVGRNAMGTDVAALGGIVVGSLTWPFLATARALLYLDLRMRREGLHLQTPRW
jgi:hypothetical protein